MKLISIRCFVPSASLSNQFDSSAAKKRDSNLLFASSSSIFEISFSILIGLLAFATFKLLAFAYRSSAAKRRDFDLLSQHRQVPGENFFSELSSAPNELSSSPLGLSTQ
ncbi:hypothetical protein, partial [Pelomonas sp. Root1217]|uniref:hypothetical protein n=1 Tax=Pelomonas sp. Root1217 TaxID=1736430 RepID=UPI0012F7C32E